MYDKFVEKVNNVDASGFFKKTKFDTDKSDWERKSVMQTQNFWY